MKSRALRWLGAFCLAGIFFSLSGCLISHVGSPIENCVGNGDLEIRWLFNGAHICPSDVENVVVRVYDEDGAAIHRQSGGDAFDCSEQSTLIPGIACGRYEVELSGVDVLADKSTDVTWQSTRVTALVYGGQRTVESINLYPEP